MMKITAGLIFFLLLLAGCNNEAEENNVVKMEGKAQGTTYHISYISAENINIREGIDSILRKIDSSMSTYLPSSIISRINKNDSTAIPDDHFMAVFNKAREVSAKTDGLFDVTVAPIVNAWGFGFSKKEKIDSTTITSLLPLVGYQKINFRDGKIVKNDPAMQLDFNAIAQGYTVDVLAAYMNEKGIENYLVELGGELIAKGKKAQEDWKVGIDLPLENDTSVRKIGAVVPLLNRALATSGNYRKFYEEGGKKYAHIIDPHTGYPARQYILSATVLAADAMTADAYATAFMVMGLEQSKKFLQENKALGMDVYFIYDDKGQWRTYASDSSLHILELKP